MLSNAQKILIKAKRILTEKAGKDGNYYTDKKYVRMAGRTAWQGVIVGLNEMSKNTGEIRAESVSKDTGTESLFFRNIQ